MIAPYPTFFKGRNQPIKRSDASSRNDRAQLNEDIRALQVRLVGSNGEQVGIVPRSEALAVARQEGKDLVLVAPDSRPPVCKILDYSKHLFDQKKIRASQRKKQKQMQVKEMKFRPGTDEGDYQTKLRNVQRFLGDGDKVKINLRFRGREMVHRELGEEVMERIASDLEEVANVETEPKFEGRQLSMVLTPKKKKK